MSVDALTRPLQASAVTGWMLAINKREYQLGYQGLHHQRLIGCRAGTNGKMDGCFPYA